MSKPIDITDASFDTEVLKSSSPVLVDFWATWCGPCRMIAPILEEVAREVNGSVKITKLDVDANRETAAKYNIGSIPTLILFKDGQVVDQIIGALTKTQMMARLNKVIA